MRHLLEVGLCASCAHVRVITNRSGSRFHLCERSRSDPAYARYPRLPMLRCRGHVPRKATDGAASTKGDSAPGKRHPGTSGEVA